MTDKSDRLGLAGYLGKYADKVFMMDSHLGNDPRMSYQPVLESDEYSVDTYCRVKINSDDGDTYQNMPLGMREIYAYPNGDQTQEPVFKGVFDSIKGLIPCHKNEKGDYEIITENQQIQIIQSASNYAKELGLPQTIIKTNFLKGEPVFQSEEVVKGSNGSSFRTSEAYTLVHVSSGKQVGPTEYYLQSSDGKGNAKLFGLLSAEGHLTACTRNAEGNFEFEDENHQKQIVQSAENELGGNPDKHYQVMRTDYFMGRPLQQQIVKENGNTYTLAYRDGDQPVGPIEYYTKSPNGFSSFTGFLGGDGRVIPCTCNADGNFEFEDENHQKQVVESAKNILNKKNIKELENCTKIQTDYEMGQLTGQQTLPVVTHTPTFLARTLTNSHNHISPSYSGPRTKNKLTSASDR